MTDAPAFDPDTGTLALPDQTFDALIAIRRDSDRTIHPSHLHHVQLLHDLGVITGTGVHRVLLDGLSAVAAKQTELNVRVTTPHRTELRQAWLLGDAVGWVTSTDTGVEFRSGQVERIPEVLAAAVELGPRADPVSDVDFALSPRVFDAMLAGDEVNRQQGAEMMASRMSPGVGAWVDDLHAGRWRSWHFEMKWQIGRERFGRGVIGIDLPSGYLAADPLDEHHVDVTTVRASILWRRLLRLMPPPEALAPAAPTRESPSEPTWPT